MSKIIVVSTRPPTTPLSGGMAPAVKQACEEFDEVVWYAVGDRKSTPQQFENAATHSQPAEIKESDVEGIQVRQIMVDSEVWTGHYDKMSNSLMWPAMHDRLDLVVNMTGMDEYGSRQVNDKLAETIAAELRAENDTTTPIWIHDYHHLTLPSYLRKHEVENPIALFSHVPMAAPETVEKMSPKNRGKFLNALEGVADADFVAFQTNETLRRFLVLSGVESPPDLKPYQSQTVTIPVNGHTKTLKIGNFPISVDEQSVEAKSKGDIQFESARQLQSQMTAPNIFLNFERCDYSKGILPRLRAFEELVTQNPELAGKTQIVIGAEPTRGDIKEYQQYAQDVRDLADRINQNRDWHHGDNPPVVLLQKQIPHGDVMKLMRNDNPDQRFMCTVTPYRDGMNLVAKEFIMAQNPDNAGVLVLSRGAGAAAELDLNGRGAVTFNPDDRGMNEPVRSPDLATTPIRRAMLDAIQMSQGEANDRCERQRTHIVEYNLDRWSKEHERVLSDLSNSMPELLSLSKPSTSIPGSQFSAAAAAEIAPRMAAPATAPSVATPQVRTPS